MIPKYGGKAELGFTDTDSFIYEIKTDDVYEGIHADVPTMFHTSAYPEDHPAGLRGGATDYEQESARFNEGRGLW